MIDLGPFDLLVAAFRSHDWEPTGDQELVAAPSPEGPTLQPFDVYECSRCGAEMLQNPDYPPP